MSLDTETELSAAQAAISLAVDGDWSRARAERAGVPAKKKKRWGRYKYWTKRDIDKLRRLAAEQLRPSEIARRFNLPVRAVRSRALRERISLASRAEG